MSLGSSGIWSDVIFLNVLSYHPAGFQPIGRCDNVSLEMSDEPKNSFTFIISEDNFEAKKQRNRSKKQQKMDKKQRKSFRFRQKSDEKQRKSSEKR